MVHEGGIEEFTFDYSLSVPANTTVSDIETVTHEVDVDVILDGVTVAWPQGTNSLVGVQVRRPNGERLLPRDPESRWLSFDGYVNTFPLKVEIEEETDLQVRYINYDEDHGHNVNTVAHFIVKEEYEHQHGDDSPVGEF